MSKMCLWSISQKGYSLKKFGNIIGKSNQRAEIPLTYDEHRKPDERGDQTKKVFTKKTMREKILKCNTTAEARVSPVGLYNVCVCPRAHADGIIA
jgi:hypothetical protein